MADKITPQRKLLRPLRTGMRQARIKCLDVGVNVRDQGQLHGRMVNGESAIAPSCRMGAGGWGLGAGGWGVMFQINLVLVRLGAEVCGGVVFQVIAVKGGKGSKVAA